MAKKTEETKIENVVEETEKEEVKSTKSSAIIDFLWYKAGDKILEQDKKHISKWKKDGLVK